MSEAVRGLTFQIASASGPVAPHLENFRQMTNEAIRVGLEEGLTSRNGITKAVYRRFKEEFGVCASLVSPACEVAAACLKNHRQRVRKSKKSTTPHIRRPFLKVPVHSPGILRERGVLQIAMSPGKFLNLKLHVSDYHRKALLDPENSIGEATVFEDRVVVPVKQTIPTYEPKAMLALDTNLRSVDGILLTSNGNRLAQARFPDVETVRATHFRRRRWLAKKKAHDRRVAKRLLDREGRRERNRVKQRLHRVSKSVVEVARATQSAIVLEELTLHGARGRSHRMNRRLNCWPRRQLHHQIEYKAAWAGVPVLKVPAPWTSRSCPVCGWRNKSRKGRFEPVFECGSCGWQMDRQFNAGLNIANTALADVKDEAWARGLRFDPGALDKDVVMTLYEPLSGPHGRSGVQGVPETASLITGR